MTNLEKFEEWNAVSGEFREGTSAYEEIELILLRADDEIRALKYRNRIIDMFFVIALFGGAITVLALVA